MQEEGSTILIFSSIFWFRCELFRVEIIKLEELQYVLLQHGFLFVAATGNGL